MPRAARRLASDIRPGSYVNVGVGLPTLVTGYLTPDQDVTVHAENGILGLGPAPAAGEEDADLIDPGKNPATLLTGGAFVDHTDSFMIIRGGHLDLAVLGAFEVSAGGDLANWTSGGLPAVGGAMDLAVGARQVWVLMRHADSAGRAKLVDRCRYPVTARGVVRRVYTENGLFVPSGTSFRRERL